MSGEAQFEMTAEDNVRAMRTHARRSFGWFAWLILGIALWFLAIDLAAGESPLADTSLWLIVALGLAIMGWDRLGRDRIIRSQFRQSQAMRSPLRIRWDDEALAIDTNSSQARYEWTQFHRWSASKTTLLLYRDAAFFIPIPRRAVGDRAIDDMTAALKAAGVKQR